MQIVIDIPEDWENGFLCLSDSDMVDFLYNKIRNGTVLPKHGQLIDADKLWDAYHDLDYDFYEALDAAPTILEATDNK